ncbi:MAG TPA: DUF308 domain-containing protein [Puia sp.]|uniref:HdeD family acid-resistance protein n=1 Tax=Puia sp. TaxID=2045100 RepID=UPI002C241D2B|nr:DUF308 domain-containing protein [Puia sp.]HVU94135.1 DUF308 domain-containing protein [Puia sp.]
MSMISEVRSVVRYWWLFLLVGMALLVFSLVVFGHPVASYGSLSPYFELAFVINGLAETGFALGNRRAVHGWGWHLAGGFFDLLVAGVLFFTPVLAAVSLPFFAGFWLLFRSISIAGRCFDLPVIWQEKVWMALLGVAGLVFSFLVLYNPVPGNDGLSLWTACALLSVGLFYLFFGIHLRSWKDGR